MSGINIINISLKVQKAQQILFHPFPIKWIEPLLDFECILASMHHFWSSIINRKGSSTKTNKTLTKFPQVMFLVPFLINFSQKVDGMPLSSSSRWVTRSVTKEILWWYWLHTLKSNRSHSSEKSNHHLSTRYYLGWKSSSSDRQEILLHLVLLDFPKRDHLYVSGSPVLSNIKTHQVIMVCNSSCAN